MPTFPRAYTNLPPPEVMEEARRRGTFSSQITGERHTLGGADPKAANIPVPEVHPSVTRHNAIMKDMASHTLGYVTFLGQTTFDEDTGKPRMYSVHDTFISANGHRRVFQQFISEPVYYDDDLEHFQKEASSPNPSWIVTPKPLNPQALRARSRLATKTHTELVNIARATYPNVIKEPDKMVHEELVEALLKAQFPNKGW